MTSTVLQSKTDEHASVTAPWPPGIGLELVGERPRDFDSVTRIIHRDPFHRGRRFRRNHRWVVPFHQLAHRSLEMLRRSIAIW